MTDAPETCWTLIRAAAAGDPGRREEFGSRYLPAVRATLAARWRGGALASDVDDAVQEVFLACLREGGALERASGLEGGFRRFLYGVTRNVALHWERTRSRRVARVLPSFEGDPGTEASGLSSLFDREYARAIVAEALATMTTRASVMGRDAERRVELLRARTEADRPIREIARSWGVDPKALHLQEAKAKREFRSALRQVVGIAEGASGVHVDRECDRLLDLLDGSRAP